MVGLNKSAKKVGPFGWQWVIDVCTRACTLDAVKTGWET